MSDYASAAEKARRTFAAIARLEAALARAPDDTTIQINLAAHQKRAHQIEQEMLRLAEYSRIELCNYRIVSERDNNFRIGNVAESLLEYQNMFSQIHDSITRGPKQKAIINRSVVAESAMEFAYSYSGSLGIVLFAQSARDLFDGRFDKTFESLFRVVRVKNLSEVRDIASAYGNAVIRRLYNWSASNIRGGYSIDLRWIRSDGRHSGEFFTYEHLIGIENLISLAGGTTTNEIKIEGVLVGIDFHARNFRFVDPDGADYRGNLSDNFSLTGSHLKIPSRYIAHIVVETTISFITDREDQRFDLLQLHDLPGDNDP